MLTIDFEIVLVIAAALLLLSFSVWLDHYISRRRSAAINANHIRRVMAHAGVNTPRILFRRKTALRDSLGNIVAVKFEEIRHAEFEHSDYVVPRNSRTLLLPAAA